MKIEDIEAIFKRYRNTQIGELCKHTYELIKQLEQLKEAKEDERKEIKGQGSEGGESDR